VIGLAAHKIVAASGSTLQLYAVSMVEPAVDHPFDLLVDNPVM
jgi:hypothetical protein